MSLCNSLFLVESKTDGLLLLRKANHPKSNPAKEMRWVAIFRDEQKGIFR